ncbi:hypothetical protein BJ875DRAFT_481398 [Amylocarpus encephaloides]|uniref:Uncharacterized protein n=1 Tax=Amylocarpus encephaloides TaxID=45428 RepID=A0A9P8C9Q5_9HELO|nr:hypothetical protein BJ875DRAFT_481398 [Amylocarpus encephaloides]
MNELTRSPSPTSTVCESIVSTSVQPSRSYQQLGSKGYMTTRDHFYSMPRTLRVDQEQFDPYTYSRPTGFIYQDTLRDSRWTDREKPQRHRHQDSRRRGREERTMARVTETLGSPRYQPRLEPVVGFWDAVTSLHGEVARAETFFANFIENFQSEIREPSYLSKKDLDAVWASKIAGIKQKDAPEDAPTPEKHVSKFADTKRSVTRAFEYALRSTVNEGGSEGDSACSPLNGEAQASVHSDGRYAGWRDRRHQSLSSSGLSVFRTLVDPEKEINKRAARQDEPDGEESREVDDGEF